MESVKTSFVNLAQRTPGALYEPAEKNERQRIAVLIMHSDEDYLSFPGGTELAGRGYTVLCANVRSKGGIIYSLAEKILCVKAAVEFLRCLSYVEKIVLLGHSGGGNLMSAYQAIAENGSSIFQTEDMIVPYPGKEKLPPADGVLFLNTHWGNSVMQLLSLDPAVEDENSGIIINEDLNMFNPANGFRKEGSAYSKEFIEKF
ncbi:MAG: hypothetical protein LUI13_11980 [Lachnospiraceae bacterium]|nr:hypothetical protein [Lachnospiraceae bacterium]